MDCPEDADTYIHRVGRTARNDRDGKALLLLAPSEEAFVDQLAAKNVPITETEANLARIQPITPTLQSLCAEDPNIKYLAQKYFISYMRSVYLQGNKAVFQLDKLPADAFALSLGLPAAPRIKLLQVSLKESGSSGINTHHCPRLRFAESHQGDWPSTSRCAKAGRKRFGCWVQKCGQEGREHGRSGRGNGQ